MYFWNLDLQTESNKVSLIYVKESPILAASAIDTLMDFDNFTTTMDLG